MRIHIKDLLEVTCMVLVAIIGSYAISKAPTQVGVLFPVSLGTIMLMVITKFILKYD